ncbi:MAG: ImmA/IrrE family metallo-endopeptidase [Christensenellaceae bacterium]|nr:ImmA/IrrE family metallo-endopeptidase [Christensenellaceae bacterium]
MEVYEYSFDQIEKLADEQNLKYDPTRLKELKPMDVYDYAEKILGITFDWKYLTPTRKIDGVTFFTDCTYWVWPCSFNTKIEPLPSKEELLEKYKPYEIDIKANTIIIDQYILDERDDYKEKFTVAHECGHYVCHPKGFSVTSCEAWEPYEYGSFKKMTPAQKHERHANHFAAALLMPRDIIFKTFQTLFNSDIFSGRSENDRILGIIQVMADKCKASAESMSYRLIDLEIISKVRRNVV